MAITLSTTLAVAITAADQKIKLTSGTNAAVGMIAKMEQEYALITAIASDGVTCTVSRLGLYGGAVAAHKILTPVEVSAAADFPGAPTGSAIPIPYSVPELKTYGAGGALQIPNEDASLFLVGTTTACTLALPSTAQDGLKLTVQAGAAQAYVVTLPSATGYKNTTGSATFGGAIGDNMVIQAYKGQWLPVSVINVTFA